MSRIKFTHKYNDIISIDNLLEAWREFIMGKKKRKDVQEFERNLMANIIKLHNELDVMAYKHDGYEAFNISDPKPRNINKATVRDRLLHHSIYRIIYPFFNRVFMSDSFSCRDAKGTHKALNRFRDMGRKVSRNNSATCWVLKCDIRKFFDNIDHKILVDILNEYIQDKNIIWLLEKVIYSFSKTPGRGLPLGNLTSQLFVNIYMNEFDQYIKHSLKVKYYIRYADDFVIISKDKSWLEELLPKIGGLLSERLKLSLHPDKVYIKTLASGVDFLGWVHFPNYRILRTTTKRRMLKNLSYNPKTESLNSYLGLLKHGNAFKLRNNLMLSEKVNNLSGEVKKSEYNKG